GNRSRWTVETPVVKRARKYRTRELARLRKEAAAAERARPREENMLEGQRRWCEANTPYGRVTFEEKRALEQRDRDAAQAEKAATAKHVGGVGKRCQLELTLVHCRPRG